MIALSIKADMRPVHRAMSALGARQVPFATSLALNELAKGVATTERSLIDETFKTPTPFTERAYRIEVATKDKPVAVVAAKDIQETYLAPYVFGGMRSLGGKRGMLVPKAQTTNQYGNLPKAALARLKGKPGIFIGPIRTRAGKTVNGVWQRPTAGKRPRRGGKVTSGGGLKLLIQFEDTTEAPKKLDFFGRAQVYLKKNAAKEFDNAMRRALSTAR